jgi:hypothetical protein
MRKMYLILAAVLFTTFTATTIYAQDIIVTKKGTKIEAKISEIGLETVKYKEFSYQDGPDYVMKKSEIASILYSNGEVLVFEEYLPIQQPKAVTEPNQASQPRNQPSQPIYQPVDNKDNEAEISLDSYNGYPIYRDGHDYYIKGTTKQMDRGEYSDFLARNCPSAYNTYKTGRKTLGAGIAFGCIGGAMIITGSSLFIAFIIGDERYSYKYGYYYYYYDEDLLTAGIILTSVGGAFELGLCMPLCITGKHKMRNSSVDEYNDDCTLQRASTAHASTAKLSLGFSPNKLSLNLNFRSK